MRGFRNFLSTLVAIVAILSTSAWSAPASACFYDSTPSVVGGAPAQHVALHSHHLAAHQKPPARPYQPGGPAMPRLDCAACMAVLPNFTSTGPHELMPFMPEAETFEPLSGISPALDPPPPRAEKS